MTWSRPTLKVMGMTSKDIELTLDTLTVGLIIPADPSIGTPAGVVTVVEHRACGDHGPEGNAQGWTRLCYYCEAGWTTQFEGRTEPARTALRNEYLWTDADRQAWEQMRAAPKPEAADYDPFADF